MKKWAKYLRSSQIFTTFVARNEGDVKALTKAPAGAQYRPKTLEKHEVWLTGFKIQDSSFKIQDSGFKIQDSG